MAHIHLIHPAAFQRQPFLAPMRQAGWSVSEYHGRTDVLSRLASPLGQRFGDLVVLDLEDWLVPGTSLVRALRRQVASPLPVLVRLPPGQDLYGAAAEASRRAGANLLVESQVPMSDIARYTEWMTGRAPLSESCQDTLITVWQQQCELLGLSDHAAASVLSARRVFEGLLALRMDDRALDAAMSLATLVDGPVPLARWAGWFHPGHSQAQAELLDERRNALSPLCLVFDAGGQRYALPMDAAVFPGSWWSDGHPSPEGAEQLPAAVPLVRLLGSSGFRRMLLTDRATIVLKPRQASQAEEVAVRVDEVLGLETLLLDACPGELARASGCLGLARDVGGESTLVLDGPALMRTLQRIGTTDLARFG